MTIMRTNTHGLWTLCALHPDNRHLLCVAVQVPCRLFMQDLACICGTAVLTTERTTAQRVDDFRVSLSCDACESAAAAADDRSGGLQTCAISAVWNGRVVCGCSWTLRSQRGHVRHRSLTVSGFRW